MPRLLGFEPERSGQTVADSMLAHGQSLSLSLASPPTTLEDASSSSSSSSSSSPSSSFNPSTSAASPIQAALPRKRRISHDDSPAEGPATIKRAKTGVPTPESTQPSPRSSDGIRSSATPRVSSVLDLGVDMERVRDVIQHQFGLEILCKHRELRLIDQEMAKCQIALEQLRRCHLMPYPVNIPTPEQMLAISNGTGPAVTLFGQDSPAWAPPYGVTDGPYARHYAKWLIPDPTFDGLSNEAKVAVPESQPRGSVPEGRTTRKGLADSGNPTRSRHGRSHPETKHQALPYLYPTSKDKAGPCTLKRAQDGRMVKLACLDCHRENFSSTQGFINHCRIAHKRDFKSHEEAAIACGHPIDTLIGADGGRAEKKLPPPKTVTALHPYSRHDMTDKEAFKALRARISASMELYKQGKLPGVTNIPSCDDKTDHDGAAGFEPSQETPYLSQFLERRKYRGNLRETVANAKVKLPPEALSLAEESDEAVSPLSSPNGPLRPSVMMRVPARSVKLSVSAGSASRPTSSKGRAPVPHSTAKKMSPMFHHKRNASVSDEDLDMDAVMSPGALVSNAAPSLVSDDGEFDSDEGYSVSGASESLDRDSISDVAEISLDDEHESRTLRRCSNGMMKLRSAPTG